MSFCNYDTVSYRIKLIKRLYFSASPSTSTLYINLGSSSSETGGNLGSSVPALIAFLIISSAILGVVGEIVPIQPRRLPSNFRDTNTPALLLTRVWLKLSGFYDFSINYIAF